MRHVGQNDRSVSSRGENSLKELYESHVGKVSDKWMSYLDFYSEIFSAHRLDSIRILEIGVQNGGSLEIWAKYFPNAKNIVGCEIVPAAGDLNFDDSRISVIVGDANASETVEKIRTLTHEFDIIIDDGSHRSDDIVRSFALYFPLLRDGGIFIAEDLHCAYWKDYQGGIEAPFSSMNFFKRLTDLVNREHWGGELGSDELLEYYAQTYGAEFLAAALDRVSEIRFRNSICMVVKGAEGANNLGLREVVGTESMVEPQTSPKLRATSCVTKDESENPFGPGGVRLGVAAAAYSDLIAVNGAQMEALKFDMQQKVDAAEARMRDAEEQRTEAGAVITALNATLTNMTHALETRKQRPQNLFDREITARCNISLASIAALIARHKVISFDVFDTLLARRVAEPKDVFRLLEARHGLEDFVSARIKAEHLARRRFGTTGSQEVTIEEIYLLLSELRPDISLTVQDELDIESELLFADPSVAQIVEMARAQKKRLIAVSDMYLGATHISALLKGAGVVLDRVYSSADHRDAGYGKFNGRMYGFVAQQEGVKPADILHFGDNEIADFRNALENAVAAVHVHSRRSCLQSAAAPFTPVGTNSEHLTGALINGQIQAKLPHLMSGTSRRYAYGYNTAGPLMLGFCRFIAARAAEDGITRLALVARDGYIVEQALDILKLDLPEYGVMPFSRRMAIFPTLRKDAPFVQKILFSELKSRATLQEFCTQLDLDPETLGSTAAVADRELDASEFIQTYYTQLEQMAEAEREVLVRHLRSWMGPEEKHSALVDVGWGLSGVRALDKILEPEFKGYFVGIHSHSYRRPGMHGYLFENGQPAEVALPIMQAAEIIELVFSDLSPGFSSLTANGSEIELHRELLSSREIARAGAISDVHQGVLDFLNDIRDIHHDMEDADLCDFNRRAFVRLAMTPTAEEYESLSSIPHSRGVGHLNWSRIGDFWQVAAPTVSTSVVAPSSTSVVAQSSTDEAALLQRLNLLIPRSVKKLAQADDLENLSPSKAFLRNPLNLAYWMAALRYRYRALRKRRRKV